MKIMKIAFRLILAIPMILYMLGLLFVFGICMQLFASKEEKENFLRGPSIYD